MTELILIDGAIIRLTATIAWGWGTSTISTPDFGNFIDVPITATGDKLTVDGKKVVLEIDITDAMDAVAEKYHAAGVVGIGGGVYLNVSPLTVGADGDVEAVTLTTGLIPSAIFTHETNGVFLETISGVFTIPIKDPSATFAAMFPQPPPPAGTAVPSTLTPLPGTWVIQSNGGNTKLKSN